jgi:phage terminase small subunit
MKMAKLKVAREGDPLTANETLFCYEYVANKYNGGAAAQAAGYSRTNLASATVTASRLLTRANIKAKISELTTLRLADLEMDGAAVVGELAMLARSDIKDYIAWSKEGGVVVRSPEELGPLSRCIREISIDELTEKRDGETVPIGNRIQIKLYDKLRPLELLGKHANLFSDDVNVNLPAGSFSNEDLSSLTTEELRTWAELKRKACGGGVAPAKGAHAPAKSRPARANP